MTWEERARRILRDTGWNLPLHSHQKIERILDAIRPIVEEEIASLKRENEKLRAEKVYAITEGHYVIPLEQNIQLHEAEQRAEQAEAHADALEEAGKDLVSRLEPFDVQRRSHESEMGGANALERMKHRLAEAVKWKAERD